MAHFQNKYGAAHSSTDAYGKVIRKDEYGNVIPTDEYGNPIRHSGTTLQGGQQQQQQRHDLSTEYDGEGGRRNKGQKEKITENIPGVGNNDHRNDTSSATTDAYGNVIRKDEYGNVIPTDKYGNPIRHSSTTLQGGQQQQQPQRHDLSTEYDGQGGRRNKGLKEKVTENIPGVGSKDHRNDTSSTTTTTPTTTAGGYGAGEQAQHHQPAEKKGVMEKIKEKVHRCV